MSGHLYGQIPAKCVAPAVESFPEIPDVKVIRPKLFPDDRGFFSETYNCVEWKDKLDFSVEFKQVDTLIVDGVYRVRAYRTITATVTRMLYAACTVSRVWASWCR
jgi:dTDP-4-dehydrorhamnose 3,5-epimerase-like enzyme